MCGTDEMEQKTLEKLQMTELEMLKELDRICRENHIPYILDGGTMLGAVRHSGFIPWDDDMDIWMKRDDYMRFLQVAPRELPEGYLLHSPLSELGYLQFHSCVLNAGSVSVEPKRLQNFHEKCDEY